MDSSLSPLWSVAHVAPGAASPSSRWYVAEAPAPGPGAASLHVRSQLTQVTQGLVARLVTAGFLPSSGGECAWAVVAVPRVAGHDPCRTLTSDDGTAEGQLCALVQSRRPDVVAVAVVGIDHPSYIAGPSSGDVAPEVGGGLLQAAVYAASGITASPVERVQFPALCQAFPADCALLCEAVAGAVVACVSPAQWYRWWRSSHGDRRGLVALVMRLPLLTAADPARLYGSVVARTSMLCDLLATAPEVVEGRGPASCDLATVLQRQVRRRFGYELSSVGTGHAVLTVAPKARSSTSGRRGGGGVIHVMCESDTVVQVDCFSVTSVELVEAVLRVRLRYEPVELSLHAGEQRLPPVGPEELGAVGAAVPDDIDLGLSFEEIGLADEAAVKVVATLAPLFLVADPLGVFPPGAVSVVHEVLDPAVAGPSVARVASVLLRRLALWYTAAAVVSNGTAPWATQGAVDALRALARLDAD